jgi:fumarylacetoacetase
MIAANNPMLRSWISVPEGSDFPIQNLPFGVVKSTGGNPFVATRIGDTVIDIARLVELGLLNVSDFTESDFRQAFLNPMMKKGKEATRQLRNALSDLFSAENTTAREHVDMHQALHAISAVEMCMPVQIGDYTDFYSSKEHATNVGIMFRDPANALLPNWLWIPVGWSFFFGHHFWSGYPPSKRTN